MFMSERIQNVIHQLDDGILSRWLKYVLLLAVAGSMLLVYDLREYRNFAAPEAMDAAQVARNLAEGRGFTTEFIRPFSLFLVQRHNRATLDGTTNAADFAEINRPHPDLANAPLYPVLLAGAMKLAHPQWKLETHKSFWSEGGNFRRYKPEFAIAISNQILLFVIVVLTFLIARKLFDRPAAWLAAVLTFRSELLWKFSVSGLPTLLLLVFLLGLVICLLKIEEWGRAELPDARRLFILAIVAGLIAGLGMLTRYSFGWLIVPVAVFLVLFGGARRTGLAVAASLIFIAVVSPWLARNFAVSGTFFGTAGYAAIESTDVFPGTQLLQSLNPDLAASLTQSITKKLASNCSQLLQGDVPRLGGSWIGILFFAGLLLGLRNVAARRLRYFTLMCLGVLVVVQSLGMTQLSVITPDVNSENLLVLLTPLAVIFGVAFFLTLLDQMQLPIIEMRRAAIYLFVLLAYLPFALSLKMSNVSPLVYPPYHPPEIQKIGSWINKDELMMSDIPWAVAWYGDRQCSGLTLNTQYEFSALNDFMKPVRGLYLTRDSLDLRLLTEGVLGGTGTWNAFIFQSIAANKIAPQFPLRYTAPGMSSSLFLTDKQRWQTQ